MASDRLDQLALDAGQLEVVAVAALAHRAAAEQAGLVADDHDGDVGAGAAATASAKPDRSSSSTAQPSARSATLGAGQLGPQRLSTVGHLEARSACPGGGPRTWLAKE